MSFEAERARGQAFEDTDVARCYAARPPYAPALFDTLLTRVRGRARALDIGCGNGKVTGVLAAHFDAVDAVDPSRAMLNEAAARLADAKNIDWICSAAERANLAGPYDLVTAGTAIHWMDPAILFPKLVAKLTKGAMLAVIDGDDVHEAAWDSDWRNFKIRWVDRLGGRFDPVRWRAFGLAYRDWMDSMSKRQASTSNFPKRCGLHYLSAFSRRLVARRYGRSGRGFRRRA